MSNWTALSGSFEISFRRTNRVGTSSHVRHGKMFATCWEFKEKLEPLEPLSRRAVFRETNGKPEKEELKMSNSPKPDRPETFAE